MEKIEKPDFIVFEYGGEEIIRDTFENCMNFLRRMNSKSSPRKLDVKKAKEG